MSVTILSEMSKTTRSVVYVRPTEKFQTLNALSRNANRCSFVQSLIRSTGLDKHCIIVLPRKATRLEVSLAHSRDYLALLHKFSRESEREVGMEEDRTSDDDDFENSRSHSDNVKEQLEDAGLVDDCPVFPGLWDLAMFTVGGAVVATEYLVHKKASIACWFDGGRHHAATDSAHGFCYMNDAVVACKVLLSSASIHKVLYVDIDIHHGDAVEAAFLYTDTVTTLSLHQAEPGFYPNTGREIFATQGGTKCNAIRIPLRRGIDDNQYTNTFKTAATCVYNSCNPDAIVLQCGVDGLCGDPLGEFNLTGTSYVQCVQHVLGFGKPTLVLGGGGYVPANAAKVWTDVLECCIQENDKRCSRPEAERVVKTSRDVPFSDDFFESYGPSFSRNITPKRMKNENTDAELHSILEQLKSELHNT